MADRQDFATLCRSFVEQQQTVTLYEDEARRADLIVSSAREQLTKLRDELGRHVGPNHPTKVVQVESSSVIVEHCGTGAFSCTVQVVETTAP